jgi:hypothetical protein
MEAVVKNFNLKKHVNIFEPSIKERSNFSLITGPEGRSLY